MDLTTVAGFGVVIGISLICFNLRKTKQGLPYPPGPPSNLLLGHLLSIPDDHQENLFYEWGKIYGDVISLRVFGKSIVVLNSVQAATDLLDKRSHNYSERPKFPVFDLMGWGPTLTLLPYGKQFQLHRRMMHQQMSKELSVTCQPFQTQEARALVTRLLSNPARREESIARFATAIVLWVAYGHQIKSNDDLHFKIAQAASEALLETGPPGRTLIDIFPILQHLPSWFPGTHTANFARSKRDVVRALHEFPIARVQEQMARGEANPSFAATQLEALARGDTENRVTLSDIQGAGAIMHIAGTDTTWVTISIFYLAMVLHPECQVKAQEEINAVIGSERLPEFSDRNSLPYLECVLQETLRWYQAVPLGLPHLSLKDDIYRGMFIPKDSIVIANARAMTLDETIYIDPLVFDPTRFLAKPRGKGEPYPSAVFGWGRRVCPGRYLVDATLWIAMATTLSTLTISKAVKSDGTEITPEVTFTSGLVSQPTPFQCNIQLRNETARSLLAEYALGCD